MKKFFKKTAVGLLSLSLLFVTACGSADSATEPNDGVDNPIKVGVVGENNEVWESVIERLNAKGISVELVKFTDYNQPNDALVNGDIDLNAFQHQIFLDSYNEDKGEDLTAIGKTFIAPLGIFSTKITDISEVKEGDVVTIPNDATNGGRALILLQSAGLIKVNENAGNLPIVNDIVENPLNLEIKELDASQTARSLDDAAIAIINSGMAVDAGFIPNEDAIYLEEVNDNSEPYVNIIVARNSDVENETFKTIVEEYQTDKSKTILEEVYKGSQIPAWDYTFE